MNYLSVCSGIEAATVAWHSLDWKPVAFSEIEPFPSAVLAHHYPHVPNVGDMTKYKEWNLDRTVDLLVGGTPCQSFSVAGLRKGLDDPRGNLALVYLGIADRFRPRWIVWENVPGVLSSNRGRDFGSFLGALVELGYGFAYRVLDAQWFGVAQRRRRVFVVGYLGDWRPATAVLFERESLRGNSAPSREAKQESAAGIADSAQARGCWWDGGQVSQTLDAVLSKGQTMPEKNRFPAVLQPIPIADQATRFSGKRGDKQDGKGNGFGVGKPGDPSHTLTKGDKHAVAQPVGFNARQDPDSWTERTGPLDTDGGTQAVHHAMAVRRLTPVECERLQGFPDHYTQIPWRKKEAADCPDGPRYKALGNSMAVPVMNWIGKRIAMVDEVIA